MASSALQKFRLVVITATLTSAAWIVAGSVLLDLRPGEPDPAPVTAPPAPPPVPDVEEQTTGAPSQGTRDVVRPLESETSQLMIPVLDISSDELIDTYSDERGAGTRLHEAIDIMAPTGTTVVAAAPGTVERLFRSDAGGNTIYVRSVDGETIYYYAHLASYAPGLNEGQQIRRGQRIGTVGSSGNASPDAPHLHFAIMRTTADAEWWEPATALNPYPLLMGRASGR